MSRDSDGDCQSFVADCRLRMGTELFAHVWDPVVLAALTSGPQRRRALRASIGGISDKALTEALHRLVSNGLAERRSYAEAPPRVDYTLTSLGRTFADGPMRALADWIIRHGDALFEAQERPQEVR
ncbi:helix-turn-helix domain-containing protein [Actinoplanes sp. NBRC 103695]|uniref:winged helix-turn-helix transcriptional regulator n=1 Tax=Actinoplanes sp. NBRC 103695 TaxID=3032202 RepID=UPI0024A5C176|nr:helix-turn-helix domain-containing protein [Actinoplanes sp. NBRC 103695]GLY97533.1 HxlR family transcriptional regulator [Actinoplanes sp. NBRC 103695]